MDGLTKPSWTTLQERLEVPWLKAEDAKLAKTLDAVKGPQRHASLSNSKASTRTWPSSLSAGHQVVLGGLFPRYQVCFTDKAPSICSRRTPSLCFTWEAGLLIHGRHSDFLACRMLRMLRMPSTKRFRLQQGSAGVCCVCRVGQVRWPITLYVWD